MTSRPHAPPPYAQQDMQSLQDRMERDHRPTMVQLLDATLVDGMSTLTVGDIFRAQAYSNKQGRHFAQVYAHDKLTGDAPGELASRVAERSAMAAAAVASAVAVARHARARAKSAAQKFYDIPEIFLTPAATPSAGASSSGAWTLSSGKRKRADP